MDKIGIFKLLTSAFDFYQKNASKFKENNEQKSTNSSQKNYEQTKQTNNESINNIANTKPLQQGMLSTMRSHDEFMNRVYRNNKK